MKTYYLYTVQAFNKEDKSNGMMYDLATISVIASTEQEAIEKAQGLVQKKKHRVSGVMEYTYDQRFDNK